jgi:hypothetical protein
MDYLALLVEAAARRPFRLHPGLTPEHYQITDTLRDHQRWRAITHCGTSYSEDYLKMKGMTNIEPGAMMEIGYVMISLKDDTIIPIARGDEHHTGFDVLSDEIAKECKRNGHPINTRDFLPIWSYGANYIYRESDIPVMLIALEKFLSYGGVDGPLQGANDLRKLVMNSSEFVARKGKVTVTPNTLAPAGQKIYDGFVSLAETIRAGLTTEERSAQGRAFQAAIKFAAQLTPFISYLAIDDYDVLYKPEILRGLKKEGNLAEVEKLFFGFGGIKNQIHNAIREYNVRKAKKEVNYFKDDRIDALWGDPKLAEDMLGRI